MLDHLNNNSDFISSIEGFLLCVVWLHISPDAILGMSQHSNPEECPRRLQRGTSNIKIFLNYIVFILCLEEI